MPNKSFTTFTNLAVSRVNDGLDRQGRYPSGTNIDLSYGAAETCQWNWEATRLRAGLYFLKCRACGAEALAQLSGAPSCNVKLGCRLIGALPPPGRSMDEQPAADSL